MRGLRHPHTWTEPPLKAKVGQGRPLLVRKTSGGLLSMAEKVLMNDNWLGKWEEQHISSCRKLLMHIFKSYKT